MKFSTKLIAIVIASAIFLCNLTTGALAAGSDNATYVDQQTAVRTLTALFSKYYPDEVSIGQPKNYVPIKTDEFYKKCAELEAKLKESVKPENNVLVEEHADGSFRITATKKYQARANSTASALNKRFLEKLKNSNTLATANIVGVAAAPASIVNKSVTRVSVRNIKLDWLFPTTFQAGYQCTYNGQYSTTPYVPAEWITSLTNWRAYKYYNGVGSGTVTLVSHSSTFGYVGSYKVSVTNDVQIDVSASAVIFTVPVSYANTIQFIDTGSAAMIFG